MAHHQIRDDAGRSRRVQFHAPVRFENIRGPWRLSIALEAPIVTWGKDEHLFAYLHDFDLRSVQLILDHYRQTTWDRRGASAYPFGGGR